MLAKSRLSWCRVQCWHTRVRSGCTALAERFDLTMGVLGARRMTRRQIRVVGAMLEREPGRYLITQRSKAASLPLLWEFPGGKVLEAETLTAALVRELKERLGLDVVVTDQAMATHHEYASYDVDFRVFHCRLGDPQQVISHARINDHRWVSLEEMADFQFPDADAKTLEKLLDLGA
jgi:8-oxo-dGTP diphosphatase